MNHHTYRDIATDYALWIEYADPSGALSHAEFNAMDDDHKVALLRAAFGPDA